MIWTAPNTYAAVIRHVGNPYDWEYTVWAQGAGELHNTYPALTRYLIGRTYEPLR